MATLTALTDMFSPAALAFQQRHIDVEATCCRALVVLAYPPEVDSAWLARIAALPGVVLSVHVGPTDPTKLVAGVNRSITEYASRIAQGGAPILMQRAQQSLDHARELMRRIDAEQQRVVTAGIVLLVLASDQDELGRRVRTVQAACAAASLRLYQATYVQEAGFRAAGPWGDLPGEIARMALRHMPVATVAASYPFVRSGLNDGKGVVFGRDGDGGLVLLDRWDPPESSGRVNGNLNILGSSGGGKSTAAKALLLREYAMGARVLIVDPEREYAGLARECGGSVVDVGGAGGGRINPMQVPAVADVDMDEAAEGAAAGYLAGHMQRLKAFWALYLPRLDDLEYALLEDSCLAAYTDAGVTESTDPATVQTWPTIADVYRRLQEQGAQAERLTVLLKSAVQGADASLWNGQSTVAIGAADFVVLDIKRLAQASPNVRRAQFFNALSYAWDMVREGRALGRRTMLVIDEAWTLIDPAAPQALQFLFEMSKRIRKYGPPPCGASLVVVTQNISDFMSPEVARLGGPVIDNAALKLLTRQEGRDLEALTGLLRLTEAESSLLANARRGEGLLLAGNQHVRLSVEVAPHEAEIIFR